MATRAKELLNTHPARIAAAGFAGLALITGVLAFVALGATVTSTTLIEGPTLVLPDDRVVGPVGSGLIEGAADYRVELSDLEAGGPRRAWNFSIAVTFAAVCGLFVLATWAARTSEHESIFAPKITGVLRGGVFAGFTFLLVSDLARRWIDGWIAGSVDLEVADSGRWPIFALMWVATLGGWFLDRGAELQQFHDETL